MMKRNRIRLTTALITLALFLGGCMTPWSTVEMDEILPPILDEVTLLVQVESVTVTRASDGASVTVDGTEVELLYACFSGTECTRRSGSVTPLYTLDFTMADPANVCGRVTVGAYRGTVCCTVGEYRYRPVTVEFDLSYIEALFAE